jgi:beta-lactamase superfamily II metal-dependent hydrolase
MNPPTESARNTQKKVAGKATKPRPQKRTTPSVGNDQIRIRMYRVGFGDCFLISLPPAGGGGDGRHILVDCGVHAKGDIGTMAEVVTDIEKETGRKLAVLIATHAHQDHISGFDRFGDRFSRFQIGQVWLPWTWDPDDKKARKLQKKQSALTARLATHFAALGAQGDAHAAAAVENLKGNAHAISLLKGGFGVGAKVRYIRAGDKLQSGDESGVQGLAVRFLGPPDTEEFLAQMDPPAGQHYLSLSDSGKAVEMNVLTPFAPRWQLKRGSPLVKHLALDKVGEATIKDQVASLADLAFALDQARNNESVVALLVYRDQYLLFPGDAQYGNWRAWLEEEDAQDILSRIRFLKVAHHGSVNATPKSALEAMTRGAFAAMVSTQSSPWPSIPRAPLMTRLSEQTKKRIVRSDWIDVRGAPTPSKGATPPRPSRFAHGFVRGPFWVDYVIEV